MVDNDHGPDGSARPVTPMADTCRQADAGLVTLAPSEDAAPHPAGGIIVTATAKAAVGAGLATAGVILAPGPAALAPGVARSRP
jgi:hypothetical protein